MDINLFEEDSFYNPDVIIEQIRICIHVYLTRDERDTYIPNVFFYTDGYFSTTLSANSVLEINIQTLNLIRHIQLPITTWPQLTYIGTQET